MAPASCPVLRRRGSLSISSLNAKAAKAVHVIASRKAPREPEAHTEIHAAANAVTASGRLQRRAPDAQRTPPPTQKAAMLPLALASNIVPDARPSPPKTLMLRNEKSTNS